MSFQIRPLPPSSTALAQHLVSALRPRQDRSGELAAGAARTQGPGEHRFPHELSGGQQTAGLALARCPGARPALIVCFDEPFSNSCGCAPCGWARRQLPRCAEAGLRGAVYVIGPTIPKERPGRICDRVGGDGGGRIHQCAKPLEFGD